MVGAAHRAHRPGGDRGAESVAHVHPARTRRGAGRPARRRAQDGRDLETLRRVLDDYAAANPGIVLEPPEILGVETLGASGVTIRSLVKTLPSKQWEAGRKVRALVKAEFDREKIEIPFPQQAVWLRSGDSAD